MYVLYTRPLARSYSLLRCSPNTTPSSHVRVHIISQHSASISIIMVRALAVPITAMIRRWLLLFRNQSCDELRPSFLHRSHRPSSSSSRAFSRVSPPCSLVAHPSSRASPPSSLVARPSCPSCARDAPPLDLARSPRVLHAAPMLLLFLIMSTSAIQVLHAMPHFHFDALPLPLHELPPAPT